MINIKIDWTDEKLAKVKEYLETWIIKHGAYSGEMIMQDDDCQIYAPELISDIVDDILKPEIEWEEDDE